jgi:hypothetical protein
VAGKSVRLFLADGSPGGLLTAEIMNWTGAVVAAPRSELPVLLKRHEIARTGIYVLLGDDPDSLGGTLAYVGEGDEVGKRLYLHSRPEDQGGKDFWERAVVITSKDTNLTKAHARYLESRFIAIGHQAKRARLLNGTAPPLIALPEADVSDMEYFISQAQIVLPLLSVNIFRLTPSIIPSAELRPRRTVESPISPPFEMILKKNKITARAKEIDGEFTVLQDSEAVQRWIGATYHSYRSLREKLEADGTLLGVAAGAPFVFTHDQVFASPSAAAAVVAGRAANGRVEWRVEGTGLTYGGWQEKALVGQLGDEGGPG